MVYDLDKLTQWMREAKDGDLVTHGGASNVGDGVFKMVAKFDVGVPVDSDMWLEMLIFVEATADYADAEPDFHFDVIAFTADGGKTILTGEALRFNPVLDEIVAVLLADNLEGSKYQPVIEQIRDEMRPYTVLSPSGARDYAADMRLETAKHDAA